MAPVNCLLYFKCFLQDLAKEEKTDDAKKLASTTAKGSDHQEEIVFNPNVFTEFKLAGSQEVFLLNFVLPSFIYITDCPISLWACVSGVYVCI